MRIKLDSYMEQLEALCRAFGVKHLAVFGSASRNDFDPEQSDIDLVVGFAESHSLGAFDRYFGFKEALEHLFQRSVDLVEEKAIKNPYFRQAVERDKVLIYGPTREKNCSMTSIKLSA